MKKGYRLVDLRIPPHKLARGQPIPPMRVHRDRKKDDRRGYRKHKGESNV